MSQNGLPARHLRFRLENGLFRHPAAPNQPDRDAAQP